MHLSDTDLTLAAAACRTLAETKGSEAEHELDSTARALANQESVALNELAKRFEEARIVDSVLG